MTGGEISFNQSGKGGAGVGHYGTFHFSGGRITANTSTNDGNDVYLHADSKNLLYMNGAPGPDQARRSLIGIRIVNGRSHPVRSLGPDRRRIGAVA